MDSQKNEDLDKNKDTEKKDDLMNKDSKEKDKNKQDNLTNKKFNEEEKNKQEKNMNNNTLELNEEKEEIKPKQTKDKRRRVPIKDWPCRTIKEYELYNDPIGSGTYGTVFKARHIGSKEYAKEFGIPDTVALKKIKTEKETQGFPITALREIMVMQTFNHKNILKLLEVIVSEQLTKIRDVYLVFEYMEHDLWALLVRKMKYDLSQIKFIFFELLSGLDYLHKNGVLHRDLKPSNILINNKGGIKIGDFGLARFFSKVAQKRYTNQVVTLNYRAPELFLGEEKYSTEIDVWSLGCIFLELLTGNIVFHAYKEKIEEKDIFLSICKLCGNPDEKNWPGVTSYEIYSKLIPKEKYENKLIKQNYPNIDEVTFDLVKKMLVLNPKERIKIEEIKRHPYLTTHEPKMCKAEDMPNIQENFHSLQLKNKSEKKNQEQKIGKSDYKRTDKSLLGKKRKK